MRSASRNPVVMGAWAEAASGPGWGNTVIWVCLRDPWDGKYTVEAIQPDEQPPEVAKMFRVFAASSTALIDAVIPLREKWRKP